MYYLSCAKPACAGTAPGHGPVSKRLPLAQNRQASGDLSRVQPGSGCLMRTDVKVGLVSVFVVILLVVVYFAIAKHSRKAASENMLPGPQPALIPVTNSSTSSTPSSQPGAEVIPPPPGQTGQADQLTGVINPPSATTQAASAELAGGAPPPSNSATSVTSNGSLATSTVQPAESPAGNTSDGTGTLSNQGIPAPQETPGTASSNTGIGSGAVGGSSLSSTSISATHHHQHRLTTGRSGKGIPASQHRTVARTYVVRHGDTLTSIAQRVYGSSRMVRAIERANPGLDPRRMLVGRRIRLPAAPPLASRHTGTIAPGISHRTGVHSYIVRRGDNLYRIARKFYHRTSLWRRIYRANRRVIGNNPGDIRVGERLVIPAR